MLASLKDTFYSALGIKNDKKIDTHAFGRKALLETNYTQRFAQIVGGDKYQIFEHNYSTNLGAKNGLTLISGPQSKVSAIDALETWEQNKPKSEKGIVFEAKNHYTKHMVVATEGIMPAAKVDNASKLNM
jgi:hypothetical protein